jgi:hypothetical protein
VSTAATLYLMFPAAPKSIESPIDAIVLVGQIQQMARLQTAELDLQTTVQADRGTGWMKTAAGEELVFMAVGHATAGVDLSLLQPSDLVVVNDVVYVSLPPIEIWEVTLDTERSVVVRRELGWVGRADPGLESEVRREALRYLRVQAEDSKIREEASIGARNALTDLLLGLGAERVQFENARGFADRT